MINQLVKAYLRRRYSKVQHAMRNPRFYQERILQQLLKAGAQTQYGKAVGLNRVNDYTSFAQNIPIHTYEAFYPYVEQVLEGKPHLLWPGTCQWFAKSSGTTNDVSKFIPTPPGMLKRNHFAAGKDMLANYFYHYPKSKVNTGKVLSIGGSSEISKFNEHARYGDLSAVLIENMPKLYERGRAPSKAVALMDEWESKLEAMAEETRHQNITAIAGVPTWTIVLLNKVMQKAGTHRIHDVWPNLEVFFHGAVSFTPYREQFKQLIPHPGMHYQETYNASEGFFAIQTKPDEFDMAILPNRGIFYEFIPMAELHQEHPPAIPLWQVQPGVDYAMIISTMGGLWRYQIGDTVRFTQAKAPYKLIISGRTKHFINAFGEEVVVGNTDMAIATACHITGAQVAEYTAAPIFQDNEGKGGHEWVIAFAQAPDNLNAFIQTLDAELQTLNSDYAAKRYKDIALQMPTVHVVDELVFHNWMKQRGKLGGQNKVPRLSNKRDYVEGLLALV